MTDEEILELVKRAYMEGWETGWVSRHIDRGNEGRMYPDMPPKGEAESDWGHSGIRAALGEPAEIGKHV